MKPEEQNNSAIHEQSQPVRQINPSPNCLVDLHEQKCSVDGDKQSILHQGSFFHALIENSTDGILIIDVNGEIKYHSPSLERILGYKPQRSFVDSVLKQIHPDDISISFGVITQLLEQPEEMINLGIRVRHKDGTWRNIELIATNHLDDPEVQGIVANLRDVTERIQMEDHLWKSEAKYSVVVENSEDAIAIIQNGYITYANPRYFEITGYDPSEVANPSFIDSIAPEYQQMVMQRYSDRMAGEEVPRTFEIEMIRNDGTRIPVEGSGTLIEYEDSPASLIFIRDISERKQAQDKIKKSEARYSTIVEGSNDGICIISPEGFRLVFANQRICDISGYTLEETLGLDITQLIDPEYIPSILDRQRRRMADEQTTGAIQLSLLHKDGHRIPIEATTAITTHNGQSALVVFAHDITERTQAEEALRQQEQYFRSLIENSSDGIVVIGSDGVINYHSPSLQQMLGYPPHKALDEETFKEFHPDDVSKVAELYSRMLQGQDVIEQLEIRVRHGDGTWHYFEATCTNRLDDPTVQGLVVNMHDITERKKAEEKITAAQKRTSSILNNMSDGIAVANMQGIVTYVNQALILQSGYTREQILGNMPTDFFSEDQATHFFEMLEILFEGDMVRDQEFLLTRADRSTYPISLNISVISDSQGNPEELVAVIRDVTERKKMEDALRESEQSYSMVMEGSSDAIIIIDTTTLKPIFINQRAADLTGHAINELIGTSITGIIDPEDLPKALDKFNRRLAGEQVSAVTELHALHKEGQRIPVEISSTLTTFRGRSALAIFARDIAERKQAEAALHEGEARYTAIFNSPFQMAYIIDTTGKVIETNTFALEHLGYSESEMKEMSFQAFSHPDDLPTAVEYVSKILAGQKMPPITTRVNKKSGEVLWIESTMIPLYHGVELYALLGIAQDITERTQTEQVLREQEQYFRSLIENASDGIIVLSNDGGISYSSPSMEHIMGFTPNGSLMDIALEVLEEESIPSVAEAFSRMIRREDKASMLELRLRHSNGTWRNIECTNTNRLDDPVVQGVVVNLHDVTDRKLAEEEITAGRKLTEQVMESMTDGVIVTTMEPRITFANRAFCAQTQYDERSISGTGPIDFFPEDQIPTFLKHFSALIKDGSFKDVELFIQRADGTRYPVSMAASVIEAEKEDQQAIAVVLRDITDRKDAEHQKELLLIELRNSNSKLRQVNQELEDFVQVSAHDLQEPLRRIGSFSSLLFSSTESQLSEDEQENLRFIAISANRMQGIVKALSEYSQVTRGKTFKKVELTKVIDDIKRTNLDTLLEETQGIIEIPETIPTVYANDVQMRQLFHNLIGNAIKYRKKDNIPPQVTITHTPIEDGWVKVRVTDNGIGIDEKYHDRIFTMFRKLYPESEYEGLGVGLTLSKRIVHHHGGEMGVDSVPGEGASFWFTLPQYWENAPDKGNSSNGSTGSAQNPKNKKKRSRRA
ncbi:MAG: PAS domain S-box protein, partial [Chloroflexota bacterium]|nr:PAS domain S-box protein [Chloroflexota bacterium]